MSAGNKEKPGKQVQTLLTAKKPDKKDCSEKPSKQSKRNYSDVEGESIEGIDMLKVHSELTEIKDTLKENINKTDFDVAIQSLVKQKDLKSIISEVVGQLLEQFKKTMVEEFEEKLRSKTGKMQDQIDSLFMENEMLKERMRDKDKSIVMQEEKITDSENRSKEALKLGNYNEQYSRKHNIRILNFPENKNEILREEFVNIVRDKLNVDIQPEDVQAIHRIPGKEGNIRPIIAKFRNTEVKVRVMRAKKGLPKDIRFHDDITQRNLGLMMRLRNSQKYENVWFYNCNVYAKNDGGKRLRFDLFDNITMKK